jgi:hypothetical protein
VCLVGGRVIVAENEDEVAARFGDYLRDALAFVEAVAREDEQGVAVILEHANPGALARAVALIAERCAIEGALLGGRVPEGASRDEVYAVRDEVLRRVRQSFGRGLS